MTLSAAAEWAKKCGRRLAPLCGSTSSTDIWYGLMCQKCADAYARQQVEEAYREGSYQGKMRFTQMKVREAVEAIRERQEIWVIEEGVEGEGVYTLAICTTEKDALAVKACIEQERGRPCPDLTPERYELPDEYAAAIRALEP